MCDILLVILVKGQGFLKGVGGKMKQFTYWDEWHHLEDLVFIWDLPYVYEAWLYDGEYQWFYRDIVWTRFPSRDFGKHDGQHVYRHNSRA